MADYDAIVVGAGHNGLICALYLAHAGMHVAVLERAKMVGGAVRDGEVTLPGFQHDLFATNMSLFVVSPVYRDFRKEFDQAGLRLLTNGYPFASSYAHGRVARVYTSQELMERELAAFSSDDLRGWQKALGLYKRTASAFLPLFYTTLPSLEMARHLARLLAHPTDAACLLRILSQSTRQFVDEYFRSPEIKGLIAPWAFHVDCSPDVAAGAPFAYVPTFAHLRGAFIAEHGAGRIVETLRNLIETKGGRVVTDCEASKVIVSQGRAAGIRTARGEEITASRAVIASVTPRNLFGHLVSDDELPARFVRRVRRYRYAPGTFVLHLALNQKLAWRNADDLSEFNYVHLGAEVDEIQTTYSQCLAGALPSRPMLVISQTTQIDPSRAPPGHHVARIHARAVPYRILNDSLGEIAGRDWDAAKEPFADRLIDQLAAHAPNVRNALLARHAVSPWDLERDNPNLVGGDCVSGSHHFRQNYFFRPFPGWSRYATPIRRLYMIGASTWPGGGVNGGSGYLLAKHLLRCGK
jgi:phytoene dehydrogenase-like protein